jgi:predicted nucleotidyltransferase
VVTIFFSILLLLNLLDKNRKYHEYLLMNTKPLNIDIEDLKVQIVGRLKPLDPLMIILFGSCAQGTWNEQSDIDLYIVTKDDFIPKSFHQKMEIKMDAANALNDLQKHIDFDLIVHTKMMSEHFMQNKSVFASEIFAKGIRLYG